MREVDKRNTCTAEDFDAIAADKENHPNKHGLGDTLAFSTTPCWEQANTPLPISRHLLSFLTLEPSSWAFCAAFSASASALAAAAASATSSLRTTSTSSSFNPSTVAFCWATAQRASTSASSCWQRREDIYSKRNKTHQGQDVGWLIGRAGGRAGGNGFSGQRHSLAINIRCSKRGRRKNVTSGQCKHTMTVIIDATISGGAYQTTTWRSLISLPSRLNYSTVSSRMPRG